MSRARKILSRSAALAGAGLLALVAAEAALRFGFDAHFASVLELDDTCLFRLRPGARKFFDRLPENGGERIAVAINADGYRGAELARPSQGLRIAVFGDSFVEAEFSADERTFVQRLGARLSTALDQQVEAVNGGVVAYGPGQVNVRLEHELPKLAPDLLVVAICSENDYGDLVRNKLYRLAKPGELVRNRPVLGDAPRALFARIEWPIVARIAFERWERFVATEDAEPEAPLETRQRWNIMLCDEEFEQFVLGGDDVVHNVFWDHPDEDVRLRPGSRSARAKLRLMDEVLGALQRTAEASAVPLLVVVVPAAADVGDGFDGYVVDRERYPRYERTNLTAPIAAACEDRGIPHVNLFQTFRDGDADALYFHGTDVHWNDAGQELAAQVVADQILAAGLLP